MTDTKPHQPCWSFQEMATLRRPFTSLILTVGRTISEVVLLCAAGCPSYFQSLSLQEIVIITCRQRACMCRRTRQTRSTDLIVSAQNILSHAGNKRNLDVMRQKQRKVKRPAVIRSRTQVTSSLSHQCSATVTSERFVGCAELGCAWLC